MAGARAGEDNCLSPAPATGDLIKVRRPIFVAGGASSINQAGRLVRFRTKPVGTVEDGAVQRQRPVTRPAGPLSGPYFPQDCDIGQVAAVTAESLWRLFSVGFA
ncbi:hypothetical protein [Mesorhizobium loti]|uniref:hypothetical protein n=1 Tax=Rhizobium loti TaxID=381 RepID=UPI00047B5FAD|nr:hypothetical protein [Mesorhizobium loti]